MFTDKMIAFQGLELEKEVLGMFKSPRPSKRAPAGGAIVQPLSGAYVGGSRDTACPIKIPTVPRGTKTRQRSPTSQPATLLPKRCYEPLPSHSKAFQAAAKAFRRPPQPSVLQPPKSSRDSWPSHLAPVYEKLLSTICCDSMAGRVGPNFKTTGLLWLGPHLSNLPCPSPRPICSSG